MNFRVLQEESAAWADKNFPASQVVEPLLGIVEEYGELVAARKAREAAWGCRHDMDKADTDVLDAIGDMIIFTADFCNKSGYALHRILRNSDHPVETFADLEQSVWGMAETSNPADAIENLGIAVGQLAHHHLKGIQGIRGSSMEHKSAERHAVGRVLVNLAELTMHVGARLDSVVAKTWTAVK